MNIEVTNTPNPKDDERIIEGTRSYNAKFVEKEWFPLSVYIRSEVGEVIAGLTGKIYGGWLHVEFLWVDECHRGKDLGTKILAAAENEAVLKGCKSSTLDTFSFQALSFYQKRGYEVVGELKDYYGNHSRHYLSKQLTNK